MVVGAGPTGLLLGAELRRRGVDCLLIDSLQGPRHWDRATIVHPRSLELFASLGIAERFLRRGLKQRTIRLYSGGEQLGELDLGTSASPFGFNLNLSEEVTESILGDYLETVGGSVRRGCRLVGLDRHADGILATIEEDGERRRVHAEWIVGCDGLHSRTREWSGIGFEGHDIADSWAVFDATLGDWSNDYDANFGYLETPSVILTPLPDRRWRVYLRPSSPTSDLVEDAAGVIGRYEPAAKLLDVSDPARFQCHSKVAERYREGRVLLAGDAAHVCTPAQGHGMNTGLQDAFNLAWKLALVCDGQAAPALLDSYGEERRPVALAVAESGDAFELVLTAAEDRREARDRELREAFADGANRLNEVVAEVELDISYENSAIVDGAPNDRLAPGERLPDVGPVSAWGADPTGLHGLVNAGAGHTLLAIAGDARSTERLSELLADLDARALEGGLFDRVIALSADPAGREPLGLLEPSAADALGVDGLTVLAIRPDGHIGLRIDGADLAPLQSYVDRVRGGGVARP
jgi:2-polyprenyl-6-methoxyphenol hydroxylase-like FAD-dependent oxidoreductase